MSVRPDSLAKASATKVLPVPIGPVKRRPIGTRFGCPSRMLRAIAVQLLLDSLDAADDGEVVLRRPRTR